MAESDAPRTRGFLFADLRGYTRFVESHGDKAASELLSAYRTLVRAAVARFSGAEIRTEGSRLLSPACQEPRARSQAWGSIGTGPLARLRVRAIPEGQWLVARARVVVASRAAMPAAVSRSQING